MKQLKPSLITLAILLAGLALTPYIALSSAPISWQRYAAAYLPPSTPPTSVIIAGPTTGAVNTRYTFTATASPITVTLPLTYTWQATGQGIVVHTLITSTSDVAAFTWTMPGAIAITVTAGNAGGSATSMHTITLAAPPTNVNLAGPISGVAGMVYTFTAAASAGSTTPITYTWQATNRSPATHTSGLTDTMAWAWPSGTTGAQAITVTAGNAGGSVTGTHLITLTTTSACSRPLSGTRISGPTLGYTGTPYTFTAVLTPSDATLPITYTWSPAPARGQGIASASYQWVVSGVNAITLTAQNCGGTFSASHVIAVQAQAGWKVYLPLVLR